MKIFQVVSSAVLALMISPAAFAQSPDFSALEALNNPGQQQQQQQQQHPGHHHGHPGQQEPGHPGQQEPGHGHDHGGGKLLHCMKAGWEAAKTSEDQNKQACTLIDGAKAVFAEHKDAIKQGFHGLMDAWKKHPICQDEVAKAEEALRDAVSPVMTAGRDAQINIINLLSAEQRQAFDSGVHECMKGLE